MIVYDLWPKALGFPSHSQPHARILAGPGCSLKIQAQPSSAKVSHFQPQKPGTLRPPIFAQFSYFQALWWILAELAEIQPTQPKFSHFQPTFSHCQSNSVILAIFSQNGWKWLKWLSLTILSENGWIWLDLASSHFQPECLKWLNLAEYGWIFGCLKEGRVGWNWCNWLQRARKSQPTPIKKTTILNQTFYWPCGWFCLEAKISYFQS